MDFLIASFQGIPSLDLENGMFRAWWMEPMVATLSFALSIHFYWYQERKRGLSKTKSLAETIDIYGLGDLTNSLYAYWIGILSLRMFVPVPEQPDGIPSSLLGFLLLIGEIVCGIVLYDALFFVLHWLMHDVAWFRRFHRRHHYGADVEARDVLRHSLVDGALQVFCNIIAQRQSYFGSPKSRLARNLHNIIVPWMLTESHTSSPEPYVWRRWFVGVREHREHHLNSKASDSERFQQFFGYLDDLRHQYLDVSKQKSR